jgi:hypothetical protein
MGRISVGVRAFPGLSLSGLKGKKSLIVPQEARARLAATI